MSTKTYPYTTKKFNLIYRRQKVPEYNEIFTQNVLEELLPLARSDQFFDALYGDAAEGAYDISLHFAGSASDSQLNFELHLSQRPGKCLACNLTYGLPEVFSRHPLINIAGVVDGICQKLDKSGADAQWKLGTTISQSSDLHIIPLNIQV